MEKVKVVINSGTKNFSIQVEMGSNLLEVFKKNSIMMQSPCAGKGSCGKCKILVTKGIEAPTFIDLKHLSQKELNNGVRLCCAIFVSKAMEVKVDMEGQFSILTDTNKTIDRSNYDVALTGYREGLLQREVDNTPKESFGIALDIGTTTLACYLIDLINGKTIDVVGEINEQRTFGADVISRIDYTQKNEKGTELLKITIIQQINSMLHKLYRQNIIKASNLCNMAIVGNTTMIHFLLGINTDDLAKAPFISTFNSEITIKAEEIGIDILGIISVLPGISSFIGSDILAGILYTNMTLSEKYSLLIDLGTNGEIALGNKDRIITCSAAAGPAFEGANIKCGVGGVKGAINSINLNNETIYTTIGDTLPIGICGSGVLDLVAQLIKHGLINNEGKLVEPEDITEVSMEKRIRKNTGMLEFVIEEGISGEVIVFTQKDIRELQLAKAAILAAINLLIEEFGTSFEAIDKVYIAGGFGNFMNVDSAFKIGMLPKKLKGKVISMGNSAAAGAKLYLLSKDQREEALRVKKISTYFEISNSPRFQQYFLAAMNF